jgi:hypothetical protein
LRALALAFRLPRNLLTGDHPRFALVPILVQQHHLNATSAKSWCFAMFQIGFEFGIPNPKPKPIPNDFRKLAS